MSLPVSTRLCKSGKVSAGSVLVRLVPVMVRRRYAVRSPSAVLPSWERPLDTCGRGDTKRKVSAGQLVLNCSAAGADCLLHALSGRDWSCPCVPTDAYQCRRDGWLGRGLSLGLGLAFASAALLAGAATLHRHCRDGAVGRAEHRSPII